MTSTNKQRVAIVGGGVSGLAVAHYLFEGGIRPLLIEKSGRFGGLIKTDSVEGCELEAGPDSFIASKPAVAELARELGIDGEIIGSNDTGRRIFIVRNDRLVAMPSGMVFMVPGDLKAAFKSNFFTASAKLRFLRETLYRPTRRARDVSVREFVVDHFGEESLDYLTEPLLSGVYGGDAGSLSAASVLPKFLEHERTSGSLIRGVQRERAVRKEASGSLFLSFRGGMQTFTDALERSVLPRTGALRAEIESLEKSGSGWMLHTRDRRIEAENVILACPAHVNAHLLRESCPALSDQLASIPYSSALLVTLVYDREHLKHPLDGFGYLVPRRERRAVAAATWISTKFPSRTPAGLAALRAFIVGADALDRMHQEDRELIEVVRSEYLRRMGIAASPLFSTVYRWPNSMPQYTVGHEERRQAIGRLAAAEPGLYLCGNAYNGVGVPDCVRMAGDTARSILALSSTDGLSDVKKIS